MKSNRAITILFVLLLNFFSVSYCYSQIVFSKGYFVNNQNQRVDCLIKNNDWLNNPTSIQYRLSDSSEVFISNIDSIKEFGIDDFSRFVRATVQIDRSPFMLNELTESRQPRWSEETLFLKELVCGKAVLWSYTNLEHSLFFYSIDNSLPKQLVYKEFAINGSILENASFRQEMYLYLNNKNTENVKIEKLKYDENELIHYFKLYNSNQEYCSRTDFKKKPREVLNLKVVGSVNYNSLVLSKAVISPYRFDLGNKINCTAGVEFEYFLPFNSNSWSLIVNPTYEHVNYDKKIGQAIFSMNCHSISLPIGARYSYYLNQNTRLYVNSLINLQTFDADRKFYLNGVVMENINQGMNVLLGVGFESKNLGFEFKYHTKQDLFINSTYWETNYSKISLSVSYKLFKFMGK